MDDGAHTPAGSDRDAAERRAGYVRRMADAAPPLTAGQAQRIRGLLPPAGRVEDDPAA